MSKRKITHKLHRVEDVSRAVYELDGGIWHTQMINRRSEILLSKAPPDVAGRLSQGVDGRFGTFYVSKCIFIPCMKIL